MLPAKSRLAELPTCPIAAPIERHESGLSSGIKGIPVSNSVELDDLPHLWQGKGYRL